MNKAELPPIRFYSDFFAKDWQSLQEDAQEALSRFLQRLQKDPLDSEIVRNSGMTSKPREPGFPFRLPAILKGRGLAATECNGMTKSLDEPLSVG
jgi:hypothetical protein